MFKKVLIHARKSMKVTIIFAVAILIIIAIIAFFYKISYSVNIEGVQVGYTDNKSKLQSRINNYIENGEEEAAAFVQVDALPQYNICLLKRDIKSNDEEVFEQIKDSGVTYYRYYAILDNGEEKAYVYNFSDAETIVANLKDKKSSNIENITISEKYETQLAEISSVEDIVSRLYVPPVTVANKKNGVYNKTSTGSVNTATNISDSKVALGISLSRPVSGVISSRFGARSSIRSSVHTGLDIATSTGTPIVAAAPGTVTFSGWKGSYGYLMVITHSNGVQTYYGHCSKLNYVAGDNVSQGQVIAAVGSTGNSTGPHLHFEIRVNGVAHNPQNYVY